MIKPELIELLGILRDGTKAGKIEWEDLSDLEDGMFRTSLPGGLIRLGRSRAHYEGDAGNLEQDVDYHLWLMDPRGVVVEDVTFVPNHQNYPLVAELYHLAHGRARDSDGVLGGMLAAAKKLVGSP
jgi:hypothetical protein